MFGTPQSQSLFGNQPSYGQPTPPQNTPGPAYNLANSQGTSPFAQQPQFSSGPRYMAGFLHSNSSGGATRGTPLRQTTADEYASTSLDRSSPPISRGSIFGSSYKAAATPSRNANATNSLFSNRPGAASQPAADYDDAPPVDSLDEDDLYNASAPAPAPAPAPTPSPLREEPPNLPTTSPLDVQACRVVIFGFTPSQLPGIIETLRSKMGNIVAVELPSAPNANWATIQFQEAWQAARAIRRNGELINGILLGLKPADGSALSEAASRSLAPVDAAQRPSAPSIPQQQQQQQQQQQVAGTHAQSYFGLGTPVPILSNSAQDAYRPKTLQHSSSKWGLSALMGTSGASQPGAAATESNPFTQPQLKRSQSVLGRVGEALFGF